MLMNFIFLLELKITEEGIKYFSTLSDTNFATLSVVGKYRTGKSYLMNRVLLDRSNGFSVGPTINPCTKVKIYFEPYNHLQFYHKKDLF